MAIDFPNSPTIGQQFTSGMQTWQWDGVSWNIIPTVITTGPNVPQFVQATPPVANVVGDNWFNTTNGRQYVWFDGFWIEIGTSFVSDVLNTDGQMLTRVGGLFAPITRAALAADPAFDGRARGIVAWKLGSGTVSLTTTAATVYSITANLVAGRMYELKFTGRALSSPSFINFKHTATPSIPSFQIDTYIYSPVTYNSVNWTAFMCPTVTQSYTITITGQTNSGTGSVFIDGGSGIWINDIGLAIASS